MTPDDAKKRLQQLKAEAMVRADKEKQYKAATANQYTHKMPSMDEWKAKQNMAKGGALKDIENYIRQHKGEFAAKRVQRAADEIPGLENMYTPEALKFTFERPNAALMSMNPADFEKFAERMREDITTKDSKRRTREDQILNFDDYLKHLAQLKTGFDEVPFLELGHRDSEYLPSIEGHEGRHRSRVLTSKGAKKSLVQLMPSSRMALSLPKRNNEKLVQKMSQTLGENRFVSPEGGALLPSDPTAGLYKWLQEKNLLDKNRPQLPEIYAQGGNVSQKYPSIQEMIQKLQAAGRTPIVPVPNRWFADPVKHPHQQKMIERILAKTGYGREGFPSGAYINPQTGEPMDFDIMHDLGVAIDPVTGRPMMSGIKSDLTEINPKYGSITKSNLVRKGLFKHEGGDELLKNLAFLATIEKSGKGHHYGLATQYESPAELVNTMTGQNPTLRPHSRGDIFGVGDEVGRISIQGKHHPVYEKLVVAPAGSDVQGKKLHKAEGGTVKNPFDFENPEQVHGLANHMAKHKDFSHIPNVAKYLGESLSEGSYKIIEDPRFQKAIHKLGHDSYFIQGKDGKQMYRVVMHKAMGGSVNPSVAQMRLALNQHNPVDFQGIGVNEAPNMSPKVYMPPDTKEDSYPAPGGVATQSGMPIGGIDMSQQQGTQLAPQPQQAGQPNQPPQGMPGAQGQPPMGVPPEDDSKPTPNGGNILQTTPQGQTLAALGGGQPKPPGMKSGGNVQGYASKGYVHHTAIKPNPEAGTRFVNKQLPGLMPEHPVNMDQLYNEKASIQLRPWDSTSRNVEVSNVSGHNLTEPLITGGGQGFARDINLNKEGIVSASGREIQKRIQSRANVAHQENIKQGGRGHTYDIISNMDKVAPLFTNMPLHIQLDLLKQAGLKPEEYANIENRIRTKKVQKKTPFTKLLPLTHPDSKKQLLESGALRKAVSEELASKTNQKMLDYNIEDLLAAVTDPHIHAAPAGYAGNTFLANIPYAGLGPKRHEIYDTSGYGEYAGKGAQVPAELYMADTFDRISKELQKKYPKAGASAIRSMTIGALQTRAGKVSQMVNDRVMKNIERFNEGIKKGNIQDPNDLYGVLGHFYKEYGGYKKGGKVKLAPNQDTMRLELSRKK